MIPQDHQNHRSVTVWQIAMLILCVYVLLAMAVQALFNLPEQVSAALDQIDFAVCMLFLLDFFFQFFTAESKLAYMKWGWIDLVSSIPNLQIMRWGRMFRIVRILRILRGVRSTRLMFQIMFTNRSQGVFASTAITCFILVIFATIAVLLCETAPNANIKNAGDAFWWAFSTITTVGYGDFYPVSAEGRIIAAVLMTAGIALFGTFTAYVASWFFEAAGDSQAKTDEQMLEELHKLNEKFDRIEKKLSETAENKEGEAELLHKQRKNE